MTTTFEYELTMTLVTCCNCGVAFGMPDSLNAKLLASGTSFYCPNGHAQHYSKTTEQKLREEIEAEKRRRASVEEILRGERLNHENTRRSLAAQKGQITKIKKRVAHGVCICCNRQFENLERHMKSKHPELIKETDATRLAAPKENQDHE